jgi:hypothetical protein
MVRAVHRSQRSSDKGISLVDAIEVRPAIKFNRVDADPRKIQFSHPLCQQMITKCRTDRTTGICSSGESTSILANKLIPQMGLKLLVKIAGLRTASVPQ